jgi:hypothetical protein
MSRVIFISSKKLNYHLAAIEFPLIEKSVESRYIPITREGANELSFNYSKQYNLYRKFAYACPEGCEDPLKSFKEHLYIEASKNKIVIEVLDDGFYLYSRKISPVSEPIIVIECFLRDPELRELMGDLI